MTKQPITLTTDEQRALRAAFASATGNGHDFGFTEDVVHALRPMKKQAVGALLTSLQQKKVIYVHEPVTTNGGTRDAHTYIQFTWEIPVSAVEALLSKQAKQSNSTQKGNAMIKQAKQSKSVTISLPFRVVVRGTLGEARVRRVQTVWAPNEGAAAEAANESKLLNGLKNVYLNVFPPLPHKNVAA